MDNNQSATSTSTETTTKDQPLSDVGDIEQQTLSKKAQKKAAKQARLAELKLERRAREKAAKKEKKRLKREAGEPIESDARKRARKEEFGPPFMAKLVIDLGFDSLMTDKEITSLTSQLAYCYSANRRAKRPFSTILFTSLGGKTKDRLERLNDAGYQRWHHCEWWEEGYDKLWEETEESKKSRCQKDKVVYLTADAEEELSELQEDEVYIIGGICDHNRYKYLCKGKADKDGIRAARLPIGKYLSEMTTRKVLTVNQVVEILVKWTETRNWEEALYSVIPKRKFQQGTKTKDGSRASTWETATSEIDAEYVGDTAELGDSESNNLSSGGAIQHDSEQISTEQRNGS